LEIYIQDAKICSIWQQYVKVIVL